MHNKCYTLMTSGQARQMKQKYKYEKKNNNNFYLFFRYHNVANHNLFRENHRQLAMTPCRSRRHVCSFYHQVVNFPV